MTFQAGSKRVVPTFDIRFKLDSSNEVLSHCLLELDFDVL